MTITNSSDIPVRDEVRIIELALELMADQPIPAAVREFEAGRLHFRNFVTTPLAKIVVSFFRRNLKTILMNASRIAGHVFRGVHFSSFDLGPTAVRIRMENNDYPIDHFRGLFYEWVQYAGFAGAVHAFRTADDAYEYTIRWQPRVRRAGARAAITEQGYAEPKR